jgi:PAS domain S-box-containing protein
MAQLESRRSQARTHESEARLRFLDRLAEATQPLTEADQVMATTARLLAEHLKVSVCAYADMDEDEDGFTIRGDWAAPGSTSIVGHYSLADFGALAVEKLGAGLPFVVNDNLQELAPEEAATFQNIGIAATICMPLVKEGRLTALMAIHDRVPRQWTDEELNLLREVTARSWAHVERVGATAELRASEGRFRAAIDAVQGVLWTNNAAGEMEGEQPGWAGLTGQSFEEYRGYGWATAVHPEDAESTIAAWNLAVANKQTFRFEHRLRRWDGEWRRFSIRAIPIFDAAGEIAEWVGVHTDITAREAAEAALRASEARLRAVFEQAAAGFARTDLTGRFQQVNDRYCTIVGRSREELLSLRMQDLTHPDDLVANAPLFETTAAGGSSFEIEKRYLRPDGSSVWVRNSVSAVREDGAEEAILAVSIDISDRKRAEEALRELNDTLESQVAERTAERDRMWNTSPDLMVVVDFQGYFRRVNPAWTALLGYEADELVGHHVNEFVLPEDHAPTVEAYELAAEGGRPSIVNRYRHKDGSTRWISWVAAPTVDMTYATGRDVTADKRREAELAAAQEALRQSQKMEAMGQLTGGVAHDFNNLLTPIIGSLDMLVRRGVGSERERRLIDGALQSAERAKTLVQRLLAFARRQPLQPVSVEIPRLVEGMVGLIGSTLGPTIDLRVDLAAELPPAKADPNQLEMALLNLAVNARDAMPAGGELRIGAKRERLRQAHASGIMPGHYVLLSVSDTGTGMDEETLRRAIEPFFSTKGVGKGTGWDCRWSMASPRSLAAG